MFHSDVVIKEGAFVVTDAHYSQKNSLFYIFLKDIESKKLQPTQIILLGDIFDALFGGIPFTYKKNQTLINLLNTISQTIEVIYLEGNHDFNLSKLFPHVKVFSIKQQPVVCSFEDKKVLLAHGDFDGDFFYKLYTTLIRDKIVLFCLKIIDNLTNHFILKNVDKHLSKKDDCNNFVGFEEFVKKRLSAFRCDYFIEGHYHQDKKFTIGNLFYMNLGAFACNQRYFVVKSSQDREIMEDCIFTYKD